MVIEIVTVLILVAFLLLVRFGSSSSYVVEFMGSACLGFYAFFLYSYPDLHARDVDNATLAAACISTVILARLILPSTHSVSYAIETLKLSRAASIYYLGMLLFLAVISYASLAVLARYLVGDNPVVEAERKKVRDGLAPEDMVEQIGSEHCSGRLINDLKLEREWVPFVSSGSKAEQRKILAKFREKYHPTQSVCFRDGCQAICTETFSYAANYLI
jgi:hypothetical protein